MKISYKSALWRESPQVSSILVKPITCLITVLCVARRRQRNSELYLTEVQRKTKASSLLTITWKRTELVSFLPYSALCLYRESVLTNRNQVQRSREVAIPVDGRPFLRVPSAPSSEILSIGFWAQTQSGYPGSNSSSSPRETQEIRLRSGTYSTRFVRGRFT